jgi:hypothetical protein
VVLGAHGKQTPLVLEFFASELRLRGQALIVQPHVMDGDVLCWNGEVYLLYFSVICVMTYRNESDLRGNECQLCYTRTGLQIYSSCRSRRKRMTG